MKRQMKRRPNDVNYTVNDFFIEQFLMKWKLDVGVLSLSDENALLPINWVLNRTVLVVPTTYVIVEKLKDNNNFQLEA